MVNILSSVSSSGSGSGALSVGLGEARQSQSPDGACDVIPELRHPSEHAYRGEPVGPTHSRGKSPLQRACLQPSYGFLEFAAAHDDASKKAPQAETTWGVARFRVVVAKRSLLGPQRSTKIYA